MRNTLRSLAPYFPQDQPQQLDQYELRMGSLSAK